MAYEIKIANIKKIQKIAVEYPEVANRHFGKAISQVLLTAQRYAQLSAPRDTSKMAGGWDLEMSFMKGVLKNTTNYAAAVDAGSRPHFVSPQSLKAWAGRKGLNPFAVAKSIAKHGTKPTMFFGNAVKLAGRFADVTFKKALDEALNELVKK
jgi:hypothetical protein